MNHLPHDFTEQEAEIIRTHRTPEQVQEFLDTLQYNYEPCGATLRSFRKVIRDGVAHCLEGAVTAAAILMQHGHRPYILCIEARDIDHNVVPYRENRLWGAVAQSRDPPLKSKPPTFPTLRDLVLSYYPDYYNAITNDRNDLTPRGYTLIDLSSEKKDWVTAEEEIWFIEVKLYDARYRALFPEEGKEEFRSLRSGDIAWISPSSANR